MGFILSGGCQCLSPQEQLWSLWGTHTFTAVVGWTLRVPVLLSKQLVQVGDFWALWSCAYLLHVFFRKILMVLFVTETVENAIPQSLSEFMGWRSWGCCLQGQELLCLLGSSPGDEEWIHPAGPAQVLCSHLWLCAWGRGMPWIHKCGAPCPKQSSGTAWKAEELCTPPAICD